MTEQETIEQILDACPELREKDFRLYEFHLPSDSWLDGFVDDSPE